MQGKEERTEEKEREKDKGGGVSVDPFPIDPFK